MRTRLAYAVPLVLGIFVPAGCYDVRFAEGGFACGAGDECPSGYDCHADGLCYPTPAGTGGGVGGGVGGGIGGGIGGGVGGGAPLPWQSSDCSGGPGPGAPIAYEVSSLVFPYPSDATVPGFDLDGVDDACGVTDYPGSVDNGLADVTPFLDTALALVGSDYTKVNDELANAIATNALTMTMTITGWNGPDGNDPCVLVDLDTGAGTPVVGAEAALAGGKLYVELGTFDLAVPLGTTSAEFTLHDGRAIVDMTTLQGEMGGIVDRGATDYGYTNAIGMAAPVGTLYRMVYDLLVDSGQLSVEYTIDTILTPYSFDIDGAATCDGVSFGFATKLSPLP